MPNTNQNRQGALLVSDLDDSHVGLRISIHGFPTNTLHEVDHNSKAGYTTLILGIHKMTVHNGVRVQVAKEVDGL